MEHNSSESLQYNFGVCVMTQITSHGAGALIQKLRHFCTHPKCANVTHFKCTQNSMSVFKSSFISHISYTVYPVYILRKVKFCNAPCVWIFNNAQLSKSFQIVVRAFLNGSISCPKTLFVQCLFYDPIQRSTPVRTIVALKKRNLPNRSETAWLINIISV